MRDFKNTLALIAYSKTPEDVFGTLTDAAALGNAYRRLAKIIHPDLIATLYAAYPEVRESALDCFKTLGQRKTEAEFKLAAGTYGNRAAPCVAPPPFTPIAVEFKGKQYTADGVLADGDICRLYSAGDHVLKVARVSANNDLVANEAAVLSVLFPAGSEVKGFLRYLPRLEASFTIKSPGGARRVNVLEKYSGMYSYSQVRDAYPSGVDFRDGAWMLRRMLEVLGYIHAAGYVHGAVIPPHCLIDPPGHRGMLIDWSYAVKRGERVRALSVPFKDYYAPEILEKKAVSPATDLFMWAATAAHLIDSTPGSPGEAPRAVQRFLSGCLLTNPSRRPNDAWALYDEFGEVLEKLVGKPTFRPFTMPG
jgi:serine/threonine protein kinase